jgi:poly-gamma-glutamate synthesis protein (capsule biosynthesis protein)
MISPWSRDETPSGISAPLLDETSRGLAASVTISDGAITSVRIVPVYLGSSGRPKLVARGEPYYEDILALVRDRTEAAKLNGNVGADGTVALA